MFSAWQLPFFAVGELLYAGEAGVALTYSSAHPCFVF